MGSTSRHPKSSIGLEIGHRPLVAGVELGEPVHLVAPEVDPHRQVRRRRVDVDDPAPHGELAAVLDLVLTSVARAPRAGATNSFWSTRSRRDTTTGTAASSTGPNRCNRARTGADDDIGRPRGVAQPPQQPQPPAHRRQLGADPFEGQGVPRREELDDVVPEERADVVAESLRVADGRCHDEQRSSIAEPTHARHHVGHRGVGHRQRARRPPPWRRPWRARGAEEREASGGSPLQATDGDSARCRWRHPWLRGAPSASTDLMVRQRLHKRLTAPAVRSSNVNGSACPFLVLATSVGESTTPILIDT